jgi:hypothetical protein
MSYDNIYSSFHSAWRFTREVDEPENELITCIRCGKEKTADAMSANYWKEPYKEWCQSCVDIDQEGVE